MPYIPINPATSKNAIIVKTSSGKEIIIDDCFMDYLDLMSTLLEMDMKYNDFCELSDDERESYIKGMKRKIKIKELDI